MQPASGLDSGGGCKECTLLKLRLAIAGPAIVLMIVLGVIAVADPDLIKPLIIAILIVPVVAHVAVLLVERAERHRGN